jgi:hypothetical protein
LDCQIGSAVNGQAPEAASSVQETATGFHLSAAFCEGWPTFITLFAIFSLQAAVKDEPRTNDYHGQQEQVCDMPLDNPLSD